MANVHFHEEKNLVMNEKHTDETKCIRYPLSYLPKIESDLIDQNCC